MKIIQTVFNLFGWLSYTLIQVLKTEALHKAIPDNKPQAFKMTIGLHLQFFKVPYCMMY